MANFTDPVKSENTRYIVSSATPDIYTDIHNNVYISALATNITSMTTNLTGVPVDFQSLTIRIKDNGVARSITWWSKFESRWKTLPTTTVAGKILSVYLEYNIASLKWGCIWVAIESLEWTDLADLDDVTITSPVNGQQLVYNAGVWENWTPAWGWDMLASVYDTDTNGRVDGSDDVQDSPTTTNTSVSSQWGLLINIDSAAWDVARTTNGFIEDEKHNLYLEIIAWAVSTEIDTAVRRTWLKTVKLSNTNTSWAAWVDSYGAYVADSSMQKYLIPAKASTKYKLSCWVKTNNVAANAVFINVQEFTSAFVAGTVTATNKLTGTVDWTLCTVTVTTWASTGFLWFRLMNSVAGNVSDAWFDLNSMTLEEISEVTANSLITKSPSLLSFTAVGTQDNVDQSLDSLAAAVNTYTPPVAISEVATELQTFVPTKSKLSRIGIYVVAKGTGNWTVTVHDSWNTVQSSATIANASLTNWAFNYFTLPHNLTAGGTYHFHVTSTVADGTLKAWTAADLETGSYIQNYYRPSTNFTARQNNTTVSISSDEDWLMENGAYNLYDSTFSLIDPVVDWQSVNASYFDKSTGTTFSSNTVQFAWANRYFTMKVNTGLPCVGTLKYTVWFITNNTISYSFDNVTYVTLGTLVSTWGSFDIPMNWQRVVYIKNNANAIGSMTNHSLFCNIDTSSVRRLFNYPTNKDYIQTYTKTTSTAVTTAIYRETKWGFPAIEYSNGEYQFLDLDTTASGSTVAFSANGSSYTTVADGASIALTSTLIPVVWVKANITANRLYLSSNDYNSSSNKDWCNRMTVVYQVKEQWLMYEVAKMDDEIRRLRTEFMIWMMPITGTIEQLANSYIIIPTATGNINLYKIPKAGTRFSIIVKTSGTSSYTLTFNTGFKSTGTLDTGTVDSKYFTVNFISDGTQAIETSRTTAM